MTRRWEPAAAPEIPPDEVTARLRAIAERAARERAEQVRAWLGLLPARLEPLMDR